MIAMEGRSAPDELATARLRFVRLAPEHEAQLTALYANPAVMRYIVEGGRTPEQSAAAIARIYAQWKEHRFGSWALFLKDDPARLAGIGLLIREPSGEVQLGYALDQPHWGKGLATEAARALVDLAFGLLAVPALAAKVVTGNTSSIAVLARLGFRHESTGAGEKGEPLERHVLSREEWLRRGGARRA